MMNRIKKILLNPTVWIASILIFIVLALAYFWSNEEYKANAITELLSIIITLVFVEGIVNKKEKRDRKFKKQTEVIRLNNLFYIYLNQYHGVYDRIFGKNELTYNDISKLLKPSPSRINLSLDPAYKDFFRCWISVFHQAEAFLTKLDLGEDSKLIKVLEDFIIQNMLVESIFLSLQYREQLFQNPDKPNPKKMFDSDIKIIEEAKKEPKITESANAHDLYILIFNLLNINNKFINEYNKIIDYYIKEREKTK